MLLNLLLTMSFFVSARQKSSSQFPLRCGANLGLPPKAKHSYPVVRMLTLLTNRLPHEPGLDTYSPLGVTTGALHHSMKQLVSLFPEPFPVKLLHSDPFTFADIRGLAVDAPTEAHPLGAAK